ncbi:GNAT family N-acetyltransferase [Pokkaliibacter sp. MBI-7]|uniref:GNAT family N-acetyltransferase n=1 Tax=Pokkaliibacter sp. MBI-7 TaxID=3040600 RepID=UPI00244B5E5A|nr:GNAT family N-acetyltransferase [Pokkaliibacter sp. MBI-7]MDH2432891.1 GNAT family N-acetyltransferase [Pokkaliibacter sp. MBI-7]
MSTSSLHYHLDRTLTAEQFVDVLNRSSLGERRPVDDRTTIQGMLDHADLLITAWDGETLVGVSRAVTDFHYCCYLSDLAVDKACQHQGIGIELMELTRQQLGPKCTLILLAAPAAQDYYPKVGFDAHPRCWVVAPGNRIERKG